MNKLRVLILVAAYVGGLSAVPLQQCGRSAVVGNHYAPLACHSNPETHQQFLQIKDKLEESVASGKGIAEFLPVFSSLFNKAFDIVDKHVAKPLANAIVCTVCKSAMLSVRFGLSSGQSDEQLLSLVEELMCKYLQIFSGEVCSQYLRLAGPPLLHILNKTELNPEVVCSLVIPKNCVAQLPPQLIWDVSLPPRPNNVSSRAPPMYPKDGKKVLKILHLSDTHIDDSYVEGAWDECDLPLCCRDPPPTNTSTIGGKFGGWKCDIPERTLDSLLEFVANNISDIDHVIWTGDIPAHDLWNQSQEHNLQLIDRTVQKLKKYFPGEGVVLPSIGNHEPVPGNLLPSPKESVGEWSNDWLYSALSDHWTSNWLTPNQSETIKYGGYYKLQIRPGLVVVSINSVFCYSNNWWLVLDSQDPAEELVWLVKTLVEAERQGDMVHIMAHVPPGNAECLGQWRKNYYNIIDRFRETVVAQFFGHTHNDEFALVPSSENVAADSAVMFIGSSVTTYTYLNPGFRIYYVDGDYDNTTRKVLDYETWIMDLEESNRLEEPLWQKMYSAKEAFGLESLEPAQWRRIYEQLKTDDDLLQKYHRFYWKDSPRRPVCDESCREEYLCNIKACDKPI